jgi:disulfide bond formation protein DsbB
MNQLLYEKINLKILSVCLIVLCFGSVGLALISQYIFDMQPCAWCILQRIIFIIIGFAAIGSIFLSRKKALVLSYLSMELLSTLGTIFALYQLIVASKSFECGISLAEKIINISQLNKILPSIFEVMGLCGESSTVLGIPYVFFSLSLFMFLSTVSTAALLKLYKSVD